MSGVAELLELLHGARRRYRTARGVLRHRTWLAPAGRARERFETELRAAGGSAGTAYAMLADGTGKPPDRHEVVVRFWSEGSSRLREEAETVAPERHEHVTVVDGPRWWTYSPEWGAVSNAAPGGEAREVGVGGGELWGPLLDPAPWLAALDFEPRGEGAWAGRAALLARARARPRRRHDPFAFHHELPPGADAFELLVDRERGVVLRIAALLDGEEFWVSELEQIAFDERSPPETFVFELPPGEEVRAPDEQVGEHLTLDEAARRASFPVFALPELPEGRWQMHVVYTEERERPPLRESVTIAYHRADASHVLLLAQRPADDPEPSEGAGAEQVERGGLAFRVHRPSRGFTTPLTVACEREGVALQLTSPDLDEETLLDLAASLEPWEAGAR